MLTRWSCGRGEKHRSAATQDPWFAARLRLERYQKARLSRGRPSWRPRRTCHRREGKGTRSRGRVTCYHTHPLGRQLPASAGVLADPDRANATAACSFPWSPLKVGTCTAILRTWCSIRNGRAQVPFTVGHETPSSSTGLSRGLHSTQDCTAPRHPGPAAGGGWEVHLGR